MSYRQLHGVDPPSTGDLRRWVARLTTGGFSKSSGDLSRCLSTRSISMRQIEVFHGIWNLCLCARLGVLREYGRQARRVVRNFLLLRLSLLRRLIPWRLRRARGTRIKFVLTITIGKLVHSIADIE